MLSHGSSRLPHIPMRWDATYFRFQQQLTQGLQSADWRFSDSNMMHTTAIDVDGSRLQFLYLVGL